MQTEQDYKLCRRSGDTENYYGGHSHIAKMSKNGVTTNNSYSHPNHDKAWEKNVLVETILDLTNHLDFPVHSNNTCQITRIPVSF